MSKTSTVIARIEPELKHNAEAILSSLGISVSAAINMFYKLIVLNKGLPFEVRIPSKPLNFNDLSSEEIDKKLEKAYQDMLDGKVSPAKEVFSDLYKEMK